MICLYFYVMGGRGGTGFASVMPPKARHNEGCSGFEYRQSAFLL